MGTIQIGEINVAIKGKGTEKFLSLTDIAKVKNDEVPGEVVRNWMRTRYAVEYMGLWERIHNPNANTERIAEYYHEAGSNAFTMSPSKWIENVRAIGITSTIGRNAEAYAHADIAFEFASWISAEFKLYLVLEFQRLKKAEQAQLEWDAKRELSKMNYHIHTDAIKEKLIVPELTAEQIKYTYTDEADMLNVVLFGETAGQWRKQNPTLKVNMRDHADVHQLLVLANLETHNAAFITEGLSQAERMKRLSGIAKRESRVLQARLVENPKNKGS